MYKNVIRCRLHLHIPRGTNTESLTGAQYMRIRIFRISLQGPGGLNKHTEWLIGCPRLVWQGNLQGFGLVDYIFRSAWCSIYRTISVIRSRRYCATSGILYFEYGYLCDLIPRLRPQSHQPAKSKKQGAHAGVLLYSPAKSISLCVFLLDVGSHNPTRRMADDDLPQTIREALSTAFPISCRSRWLLNRRTRCSSEVNGTSVSDDLRR